MGCGKKIRKIGREIDKGFTQPLKKTINGEYLWEGLESVGAISDGGLEEFNRFRKSSELVGQTVGGIVLAPATGGASLGMTYGALAGAGLTAMQGGGYDQIVGAGRKGGNIGAITGGVTMGIGNLASGASLFSTGGTGGISGLMNAGGKAAVMMGHPTQMGMTIGANAGRLAGSIGTFGASGYGGAKAAGLDEKSALLFGAGSTLGGYTAVGKMGIAAGGFKGGLISTSTVGGALAGGYGMLAANNGPDDGGGTGGGGNYQAPEGEGAKTNTGNSGGGKGGKSVPEAQFLDGGGADWGNSGMGGTFGGLDNLRKKDSFVNTGEIKNLYAQRGVGAFVK